MVTDLIQRFSNSSQACSSVIRPGGEIALVEIGQVLVEPAVGQRVPARLDLEGDVQEPDGLQRLVQRPGRA